MVYYTSLNSYLKNRFHTKVYKLSLTSSNSCPHRKNGVGCIFCSEGSSAFRPPYGMPIAEQLKFAKNLISKKTDATRFIAYFASFTATYGDIDYLESLFMGAALDPEVVAVSFATRPDCLGQDVMNLLKKVQKIKPVFVELGLQTAHDDTAKLINRGSLLSDFTQAIENLHKANFDVVLHIILGLPNETAEMMKSTVKYAYDMGVHGVKLQLLHVLKDTPLADMYNRCEFRVLERDEYARLVADCIKILGRKTVIHRLTGDGEKEKLIAPSWSADKKGTLGAISKYARPYEDFTK